MKKKIVIIVILSIILVATAVGVYFYLTRNKVSNNITKEIVIDGIKISNIDIKYNNGISTLNADVTSMNRNYNIKNIEIYVYKKKKKYKMLVYLDKKLKKGESTKISTSITEKIIDAKKIKYKIVK